jgi:parallel beta-helix repeat protein
MRKAVVVLGFLGALMPVIAQAKTLYVSAATGNDSVSYANNNQSTPWATIGRAAWGSTNRLSPNTDEAARAGDTVIILPGTYTTSGTGERWGVAYMPANSGTASSPIVFRGNPEESRAEGPSSNSVILQLSSLGPVIGAQSRNYIVWDGFYIDEATAPPKSDTGPVILNATQGVTIQNVEIRGRNANWQDNHNGIRLEAAHRSLIRNNRIYGIGTSGNRGQNDAGIMMYDSSDNVIENNELYDCGTGVFIKGQHPGQQQYRNIIRYNLIHRMGLISRGRGIEVLASRDAKVYQNVLKGGGSNDTGISLYGLALGDGGGPRNDVFQNNTMVGFAVSSGIAFRGTYTHWETPILENNIISGALRGVDGGEGGVTQPGTAMFEHNVYHAITQSVGVFLTAPNHFNTLAEWQNAFGKDRAAPASITADPLFVDAAAGNYRLRPGSPALTLGRDRLNISGQGVGATIPAGAYITGAETIGISGSVGSPPPGPTAPAAPSSVRIVR